MGVWSIWVEVGCSGWVAGWWSSESLGWVWLWHVVVGSDQVEVQIGLRFRSGLRFCVEVQIGVAGVVGFVAVLWWVLAAVCAVGVFFNILVVGS